MSVAVTRGVFSSLFRHRAAVLTNCSCVIAASLLELSERECRIMADAKFAKLHLAVGLSPDTLRARAQRRRETAERLWDERLERLLLDEADELERRAVALERENRALVTLMRGQGRAQRPQKTAPFARRRAYARRHQETKSALGVTTLLPAPAAPAGRSCVSRGSNAWPTSWASRRMAASSSASGCNSDGVAAR